MNPTHGWSNSMVLLCCVLSFLTLPTNVINSSSHSIEKNINNYKNSEYASQKLNDLLRNKKLRVRRQLQSTLQLQLAQALQQNPGIAQQLQQNPQLLSNLRKKLAEVYSQHHTGQHPQQQQKQSQRIPKVQSSNNFQRNGFLTADVIRPTSTQLSKKSKAGGQCNSLKKQNKLLRQMLLSVTDENILDEVPVDDDPFQFAASQINLSKLNPANALLNQLQVEKLPSVSLKSSLVNLPATWTTVSSTTSYETTVVHTESTEVPILWRGKQRFTTVYNTETLSVTATEIKTSSKLITPSPTWSTETVTITPSPLPSPQDTFFNHPIVRQQHLRQKKAPTIREASVIEIEKTTTRDQLTSKNDRLRQLYGSFFSDSAQRSKERFGNTFRRNVSPISTPRKVSSFENDLRDFDDYENEYEFDQQVLAAQNRPVFVRKPSIRKEEPSMKVFTLFFSGRVPGEYTTQLTTLPVGPDGQPITGSRKKRDAMDIDINPTKVEPILKTDSPAVMESEQWMDHPGIVYIDSLLDELFELNELQSSLDTPSSKQVTSTVTITETLTKTETLCNSS